MAPHQPIIKVVERIKNLNPFSRMFNREDSSLNQESPVLHWPEAIHQNEKVSFRQFDQEWPRVATFAFNSDDEYGWVTASNPLKNLLIGYIWKLEEYPWVNFWRSMTKGQPAAFGIEFGTMGLHEPMTIVAKKGKIFDREIYDYIDAGEVKEKSLTAFQTEIPPGYRGVKEVTKNDRQLVITEQATGNQVPNLLK